MILNRLAFVIAAVLSGLCAKQVFRKKVITMLALAVLLTLFNLISVSAMAVPSQVSLQLPQDVIPQEKRLIEFSVGERQWLDEDDILSLIRERINFMVLLIASTD